jgi:hypothetical protein
MKSESVDSVLAPRVGALQSSSLYVVAEEEVSYKSRAYLYTVPNNRLQSDGE